MVYARKLIMVSGICSAVNLMLIASCGHLVCSSVGLVFMLIPSIMVSISLLNNFYHILGLKCGI